ncbi:MAG: peptidoglycan-binding protein, partial [Oscillospiraceae bacterium]
MCDQDDNNVVQVVSPPYPGTPLRCGSTGDNVKLMQTYLNAIREYLYPSLGFLKVDGIYGPNTKSTVMQYQAIKGICVDGIIGEITWNAIVLDYSSLPDPTTDVYPGTPLTYGSTGSSVLKMQRYLNMIRTVYTAINELEEDSVFGSHMADATRLFQKQFGLSPDEVIGEKTWYAIVEMYRKVKAGEPGRVVTKYPGTPVQKGSSGDSVRFVQSYMNTIGTLLSAGFPIVAVDGEFGCKTNQLVLSFQRYFGLQADGIVGPNTWSTMILE